MKHLRSLSTTVAVVLLALSMGVRAQAETPREELVHSYVLLKIANHDYEGHRVLAMKEVEAAGKDLGLKLRGDGSAEERQWKSDEHLMAARKLLVHAREKMEVRDRERVAVRLDKAIEEIDLALRHPVVGVAPVVVVAPPVAPPVVVVAPRVEAPREELVHAYVLMKLANHDYDGHRVLAMKEIEVAGRELGLVLKGDGEAQERQFKSDEQLIAARKLLVHARDKLDARDRDRVAARVEKAIRELDLALRVK